jgi:SAM-dependent methyltransferase
MNEVAQSGPVIEYLSAVREQEFPDDWYDFADASHFWMQWRLGVTLRLIERIGLARGRALRALDIGGGAGGFRGQLESSTAWTVDVTDLNVDALKRAEAGRGRTLYYDVTRAEPALVGSYDVCFLYDVIEHVPEPRALLGAALAHLRVGGHLLVNVPALQSLFSAYDLAAGHLRRYNRDSLAQQLHGLPGATLAVRYWGLSLVPLLALRKQLVGRKPDASTIRSGFEPPNALVHRGLKALMAAELALLENPPLGTSVMAAVRRAEG